MGDPAVKLGLTLAAYVLRDWNQKAELQCERYETFISLVDTDHDGHLSRDELRRFYRNLGQLELDINETVDLPIPACEELVRFGVKKR